MGNATVEPDDGTGVGVTMTGADVSGLAAGAAGAAGCVAVGGGGGAVVASGSSLEHEATSAISTTSKGSQSTDFERIPKSPIISASQTLR
jgi:hypothetical protein